MPASRHVSLQGIAVVAHRTRVSFYFVVKPVDMLIETSHSLKDLVAHGTSEFRIALMCGSMLSHVLCIFKAFATRITVEGHFTDDGFTFDGLWLFLADERLIRWFGFDVEV